MDISQVTEEQRLAELRVFAARFLSYGWEWRVITKTLNYYFCTDYTVKEMIRLLQA